MVEALQQRLVAIVMLVHRHSDVLDRCHLPDVCASEYTEVAGASMLFLLGLGRASDCVARDTGLGRVPMKYYRGIFATAGQDQGRC